jgi:cytosine deaminase
MLDMILRGATLPDGRTGQDIGIQNGKITAIQPNLAADAAQTIDAADRLVCPPFVDPHIHLDSTNPAPSSKAYPSGANSNPC